MSRIYNDVRLLSDGGQARPAAVADTVSGKAAVQTGGASRAELTFTDLTLTRLGANSYFSFANGTRDMNLQSGTMLLQVPKGAGGATIHTAGITAGITGTTLMVEYNPKSFSKVVVLEGTVRVSLTGHLGESVLVHAGQILIVPVGAKSLPDPVGLDLKALYVSSGLIRDFGPLPSRGLIDREITQQTKKIDSGQLQSTGLSIAGSGIQVQAETLGFIASTDVRITAEQGDNNGRQTANRGKYGPLNLVPGNGTGQNNGYSLNSSTQVRTDPYITTNGRQDTGRIYRGGTEDAAGIGAPSPDGMVSGYLLGGAATQQFTPVSTGNFDDYFGAVGNIAAFHFSSLSLQGTPVPISTEGGPTNLALIADTGISDAGQRQPFVNSVFSLNGLGEVLLATRQGSISLNGFTAFQNTDETPTNLTLYAQGGTLDLGVGTFLQPNGMVNLHSDNGMTLAGTVQGNGGVEILSYGPVTLQATATLVSLDGRMDISSLNGALTLDGTISTGSSNGTTTLLAANGGLTVNGTIESSNAVQATASGDIGVTAGASLSSVSGEVFLQSTGGVLNFNGTATAQGQIVLQASGDVTTSAGATLTSNGGSVYLYSANGTATNNGTINAAGTAYLEGTNVVQTGTVNAAGGLSFLSSGNLTAGGTATTAAGATLQGFGAMNLNNAQLSADTLKLQVFGNNGVLLIGGGSVLTGNTQLNLFAGGTGGRIEFTGNTTLNSSVAAVLTANNIRIDNNVTVTVTGPTALLYANTLQFTGSGGDGSTTGGFGGNGAVQAGSYTGGKPVAAAPAPATTTSQQGAPKVTIKPTVSRLVPSTYDGRYGLAALVAGPAPAAAGVTAGRVGVRPAGVSKTATARMASPATRATLLR